MGGAGYVPAGSRHLLAGAVAALAALCLPTAATALTVELSEVRVDSSGFVVELDLHDLFASLEERLRQGLPATLAMELELWRDRSHWFDARIGRHAYLLKMDFDPWSRAFELTSPDGVWRASDRATFRGLIEHHALSFPWRAAADSTRTYFFTAQVTLKLLTADDIREVEAWLSGHLRRRSSPLGIPFGLLGILKEASGLGDRSALAASERFRIVAGSVVLAQSRSQ